MCKRLCLIAGAHLSKRRCPRDQDTLRFLLREAVRATVTEVLQTVRSWTDGCRRPGAAEAALPRYPFGRLRPGMGLYPAGAQAPAPAWRTWGEVAVQPLYAAGVQRAQGPAEVMSFLLGHRYSHEPSAP
jgi:putative transposase